MTEEFRASEAVLLIPLCPGGHNPPSKLPFTCKLQVIKKEEHNLIDFSKKLSSKMQSLIDGCRRVGYGLDLDLDGKSRARVCMLLVLEVSCQFLARFDHSRISWSTKAAS